MKLSKVIRNFCAAVVLSVGAWQAHATVPPNVFEVSDSFSGAGVFQFKYYPSFVISTSGSYLATLVDSSVLTPFTDLGMAVFKTGSSPVHAPLTSPGSFTFSVGAPTSFTVLAFGTPGGALSSFGITISPIPEPEIWALMLVGTGLVGFQLRRKRKAAEANRLAIA